MMKSEFDSIYGRNVAVRDYEIIEFVYNYHPCNFSREAVVSLYKEFGIIIFKDMQERAQKAKEYDEIIHRMEQDLRIAKEKREKLKE